MTKPEEQELRPPQGGHGGGPGYGGPGHGGHGYSGYGHGYHPHYGYGGLTNLLPWVVAPYLYNQPYYPYPYPPYSPYPYPQIPYYPPYKPGFPGIYTQ